MAELIIMAIPMMARICAGGAMAPGGLSHETTHRACFAVMRPADAFDSGCIGVPAEVIMSHSTVLVVGPNPEKQLGPFEENLRIEFRETEEEDREEYESGISYSSGIPFKEKYSTLEEFQKNAEGREINPATSKYGYWYNPRAKWDWYQLGGRWQGFFKLKPDRLPDGVLGKPGLSTEPRGLGYADQCPKGAIDWDAMKQEQQIEAADIYTKAVIATQNCPPLRPFEFFKERHPGDIQSARQDYAKQTALESLKKDWHPFYWTPENFTEDYVQRCVNHAGVTYAVLKDGQWYQRGKIGWWGSADEEIPEDEWIAAYHGLIDSLADDTLLSVYDIHI